MPRLALALFLLLSFYSPIKAATYQCPNLPFVTIVSTDNTDHSFICATAAKTFTFLEGFNLFHPRPLTIKLVNEPIKSVMGEVYGSYDPYQHEISLMHFNAINNQAKVYSLLSETFDREEYAGIIAHELTHAMVQHLLEISPSAMAHEYVIAQEYLAYSTQVAVMSKQRQQQIANRLKVEAWQSGHMINAFYMAFSPDKFAIKSYLHLVGMDDPQPFITALLKTSGLEMYVP